MSENILKKNKFQSVILTKSPFVFRKRILVSGNKTVLYEKKNLPNRNSSRMKETLVIIQISF